MNHSLDTNRESIYTVVEAQAQRRRVICIPGMLAIDLVQNSINEVANGLTKEECLWDWMLRIIAHSASVEAEENEPWRPRKDAA